ncbi:MAG: hypothetical protein FWC48_04515, partial [Actinomycetia bacterium]|nr:hypothetical protein [Actinomycetes bacterium]
MSLRCDKKPCWSPMITRIVRVFVALMLVFPFQAAASSVVLAAPQGAASLAAESTETTPAAATIPTIETSSPATSTPLNLKVALMSAALPFEVSGDLNDSYNTLTDAITAINNDAGADYTIIAGQDDTITNLAINKHVLLTSASGVTATITNTVGARHFTLSAGGSLTLEDITLQGTTQTTGNTPAGGINVLAQGSLTL